MPRRGGRRPGKGRSGPWYGDFRERLAFERSARAWFSTLRSNGAHTGGGYVLNVDVDVPGYERRHLRIEFGRGHLQTPRVFADGPRRSKHRYSDGSLCMWYPRDPEERRWVRSDGLVALIGLAIQHLFREAWWRETGEWLGEEAPHDVEDDKAMPPREQLDTAG